MALTETMRRVRRGTRVSHLVTREPSKYYYQRKQSRSDAVEFFDEDWDNPIILDTCRCDSFKKCDTLPGEQQPRQTKSSSTPNFLETCFDGADLRDTAYVTANHGEAFGECTRLITMGDGGKSREENSIEWDASVDVGQRLQDLGYA